MNAVEIGEAISTLAEQPFDAAEFPFAFLQAFGNKEAKIKSEGRALRLPRRRGCDVNKLYAAGKRPFLT